MLSNELKLNNLLKMEVALKGRTSTVFFGLFAIFAISYGFGLIRFKFLIDLISIFLIINSICRYFLQEKIIKQNQISKSEWTKLKILIWLNALGFALIVNLASFELKLSGFHFNVLTTFLSGIIGASIITLSYYSCLFIPFQLLLLIPQIFIIIYYYYSPDKINQMPLVFLYMAYFVYQIIQYKRYRKEILKMFNYQLRLEEKNIKLKKSQDDLVTQTMKVVHASRLAALGEISAGIAHEINNPITIIYNSNQLIQRNLNDENTIKDSIDKNSQKITKSVERILKIIKGLKNLSHQSDSMPKEVITLQNIFDETSFFCSEILLSKNITLTIDPIPNLTLNCHPIQISQVLINLIKNAGDYLSEINIDENKWIRVQFVINENKIEIKIQNNGPKISSELSNLIFEPFYSTKDINKGTGLGLSISQKIMEEHSGYLKLNIEGEYTTFIAGLPIHQSIK